MRQGTPEHTQKAGARRVEERSVWTDGPRVVTFRVCPESSGAPPTEGA